MINRNAAVLKSGLVGGMSFGLEDTSSQRGPTQMREEIQRDSSHKFHHPLRCDHGILVHGRFVDGRLRIEQHIRCCHVGSSEDPPRVRRDGLRKLVDVRQAGTERFQLPL